MQAPPIPPQRRQSAARMPPMPPPGVPVRAQATQSFPRPVIQPSSVRDHSLPTAPKTRPPNHPTRPAHLPQLSYSSSSTSSRSPALSYDSGRGHEAPAGGLRDSTRVNIKGSAPPRQVSARLDWEGSIKSPKEPDSVTPKEQYTAQIQVRDHLDTQFETLLDSSQVSDAVRQKFNTVSQDVKSSISHSSMTSNPAILNALGSPLPPKEAPKMRKRLSTPLLRKVRSSGSLGSPTASPQVGQTYAIKGDAFTIVASPTSAASAAFGNSTSTERASADAHSSRPRPSGATHGPRPMSLSAYGHHPSGSNGSLPSFGRSSGRGLGIAMGEQPQAFIEWSGRYKGTDLTMEVVRCKKLRMSLRHESTDWVGEFIGSGGYELVLDRLQDLSDVEWREEQHDDQMLYESLRCVKALSTSEVGKTALRAAFPKPFKPLSALLFSEKKPGDLPSRQIIVELWLSLFDLFPSAPSRSPVSNRPTSVRFDTPPDMTGEFDICEAVRSSSVPAVPDPRDEYHEFITVAHQPRVFKAWVQELSDICRDYFWIMCHASNTLWAVDEVDQGSVERPVAPGGATGGVEFEAMNYATTHFKSSNSLCKCLAAEDMRKASQSHHDLILSGMDRILVTMRKASTTYYPTLHLESARYVSSLREASPNARLPHLIDKSVGPPPDALRKRDYGNVWLDMPRATTSAGDRRGDWEFL